MRALDQDWAQPLAGTESGQAPFWSPDSRKLGFFAQGKLKKIALSGGPPITLADAQGVSGGSWNRDDVILFASNRSPSSECLHRAGPRPLLPHSTWQAEKPAMSRRVCSRMASISYIWRQAPRQGVRSTRAGSFLAH